MAVMGEESPERWSDEVRRTGRVVFPPRWRFLVVNLAGGLLAYAVGLAGLMHWALYAGLARPEVVFIYGASSIPLTAWHIWHLGAGRAQLTIDRQGIQLGRRFLPWTEVGAIGIPHGFPKSQTLPIIPRNPRARPLTVRRMAVRDIPALAAWLETLLAEYRRASSTGASTWL
jgi:hypothetical protein